MNRKIASMLLTRKQKKHSKQYDEKFRDNNASQAMMLLYARVPRSSVNCS